MKMYTEDEVDEIVNAAATRLSEISINLILLNDNYLSLGAARAMMKGASSDLSIIACGLKEKNLEKIEQ